MYKVAIMFNTHRGNKPLQATLLYFFLFELKTIAAITCEKIMNINSDFQ